MLDCLLGKLLYWRYKASYYGICTAGPSSVKYIEVVFLFFSELLDNRPHPKSSASTEHMPQNRMVNINLSLPGTNSMTNGLPQKKSIINAMSF